MATFYNQATLTYNGRAINSNITRGETVDAVSMTKSVISASYGIGDTVTYAISILNGSAVALTALTLTDDLAAYTAGNIGVVPLEYVEGTARYFVNGATAESPEITAAAPLTFAGIDVPAGGNAILIYEARVTESAPRTAGATLTNTATLSGARICEPITDTAEVSVREEPILSITKSLVPDTVTCDGILTYSFIIQNTGNTAVVATDDVTVTDSFNPILTGISVELDGVALAEGVNYSYDETTGEFATLPGQITVPAATYSRDPATGVITTTPGVTVITVTGSI